MIVLSLFDGMSCGQIALTQLGAKYDAYYASEIDPYAIKVTQANFPDTIQLGSIEDWEDWDIDWSQVGLIFAGSPCQGFSFAGKQLAFDDPRSRLFFAFVDILNFVKVFNPDVKFLLENVRMRQEYQDVISKEVGVNPTMINSALVSAQNRVRLYWFNWDANEVEDEGRLLKDILETEGEGCIKSYGEYKPKLDKSQCLDANYFKGADNHGQRTLVVFNAVEHRTEEGKKLRAEHKKATGEDHTPFRAKELVPREDGKVNCLQTSLNNNHLLCCIELEEVVKKLEYRKLTPVECERLQTVPDNYTNHVSNTQRYKMLGNGWTVQVIMNLLADLDCDLW